MGNVTEEIKCYLKITGKKTDGLLDLVSIFIGAKTGPHIRMLNRIILKNISFETYPMSLTRTVSPGCHWNRLTRTCLIRGQNICFIEMRLLDVGVAGKGPYGSYGS